MILFVVGWIQVLINFDLNKVYLPENCGICGISEPLGETINAEATYKSDLGWSFRIGLLGRIENEGVRRPLHSYRFSDF